MTDLRNYDSISVPPAQLKEYYSQEEWREGDSTNRTEPYPWTYITCEAPVQTMSYSAQDLGYK